MALHPWLYVLTAHPQLLASHGQAYADLALAEIATASISVRNRSVLLAATMACAVLALTLAGVALMLWAMLPDAPPRAMAVLIATPLFPLLLASGFLWLLQHRKAPDHFSRLRAQLQADIQMLRQVNTP